MEIDGYTTERNTVFPKLKQINVSMANTIAEKSERNQTFSIMTPGRVNQAAADVTIREGQSFGENVNSSDFSKNLTAKEMK
jgi:hypothetical protein